MKDRVISIDIARVLCMIWIVGFWHMGAYVGIDNINFGNGTVTHGALAAFTFFSGLFLGKKSIGAWEFYKARFVRLYPLFFLSCLIVYIGKGGINYFAHLLCSLTGLSIFMPPHTPTLWYVDMLLVMYALTPLLVSLKSRMGGGRNRIVLSVDLFHSLCP